jgi:hypothetical protein
MTPEQEARAEIDKLLTVAGWQVQRREQVDLTAAQGIAICEYPLKKGHGFADYLLYVDGAAIGVVEAKKAGVALTGVERQTAKYSEGLPDHIPAPRRPLPFCYESTGIETRFTNFLEPDARSRPAFAFHKPETFSQWIQADIKSPGSTVRGRFARDAAAQSREFVARAEQGNCPAGAVARRQPAARTDPDGDGQRQDVHRLQFHLPADQIRWSAAHSVSGGPADAGKTDAERIPAVRDAG